MTDIAQRLKDAMALIPMPQDWCQGAYARRRPAPGEMIGEECMYDDPEAVSWSADGAIYAVTSVAEFPDVAQAFADVIGTTDISWWQDAPKRAHAEVLAAFDAAIAAVSEKEAA